MDLIFIHRYDNDGGGISESVIPFEYPSIDKFIKAVTEHSKNSIMNWTTVLGEKLTKKDIKNLKNNVYTLEDWLKQNKKRKIF